MINSEIQKYEDTASKILRTNLHVSEFKKMFNIFIGKSKPTAKNPFFEVFDKYVEEHGRKKGWVRKTFEKNEVLKSHLMVFKPDLTFDLTSNDIDNFAYYLNSKGARKIGDSEIGLKNSTAERYVSMLKWFLSWAKKNDYYNGTQNIDYKIELKRIERKEKIFFTWDELIKFYTFDFENESYNHVRDCISFMSFTSLRHSDIETLKRSDVKPDHIVVYTEKTDDGLHIDLNDYSREILNRYKDQTFRNDLALPVISNQKMNTYIKEMGKIIGFDEPTRVVYYIGSKRYDEIHPKYELLSTHVGRRTFIVNAIFLGIPPVVVMQWTGHKDYNSMKPYIAIVDELKNTEMNKFNKKSDI